jgi:hypothetical protein
MKISEKTIREIILEEINQYLSEVNQCHNPETGFFDYCEKGNVYSLSKKGAKKAGVDKKYVSRGVVSSDKKKADGTRKMTSKFGMNSSKKKSAGRIDMPKGDNIAPRYSVSKYPKKYQEQKGQKFDPNWPSAQKRRRDDSIGKPNRKSWFHGYDELDKLKRGIGLGVLQENGISGNDLISIIEEVFPQEVCEESLGNITDECRKRGFVTFAEAQKKILIAINAFSLASDGKLNAPRDKQ